MRNDPLLQPFSLAGLTLRNRIVFTPHEPAYTEDGMPKDRYLAYHRERARGGVGLVGIGGSAVVSKDSPAVFGNIDAARDEVVGWLRHLSDAVHDEGAKIIMQLTHLGWRASNFRGEWLPILAPSRSREPAHRSFTKEMEDFDIDRVVADYAAAAQRVAAAGLDGIELLHGGHLLDAFLLPRLNHRRDEYNGDLEHRLRFSVKVIDAIRAAVPENFILGVKMTFDEKIEGGINESAGIEIAKHYIDHGIQFINLVVGTTESDAALAANIPGMGTPSAPHLDICRRVRSHLSVPLLHATRMTDAGTARFAIEDGCVDLVGMTRAQLADPYLVSKIQQGRDDDIRPCVGANACLDAIYVSGAATCIHNPATGRELTLPQVEPASPRTGKRVMVVGAGPAGLEAARVFAVRGHRVTVLEADSTYGGQVRIATRSKRRRDLIGIVDWRYQQACKHGVEFRFDSLAEADDILAQNPDLVIVATGGVPDTDYGVVGSDVYDSWDVMNDGLKGASQVIVYDDSGTYPALDAVEHLATNGRDVVYVTPERVIGIDVGAMNSPEYLRVFSTYGVQTVLNERLVKTSPAPGRRVAVTLRNEYSSRHTALEADAIVIDHGTVPNDELYFALKDHSRNHGNLDHEALLAGDLQPEVAGDGFLLYRVGDAVSSRNIHAALLDSLRIGLGH
ncbi:MAG: FAD-dependent oxidoreductase [Actinomycetales bacterium]